MDFVNFLKASKSQTMTCPAGLEHMAISGLFVLCGKSLREAVSRSRRAAESSMGARPSTCLSHMHDNDP